MDFLYGVLAAMGTLIPIVVAAWRLMRKTKREDNEAESKLTEAQRSARDKRRRTAERTARDEYRDLYTAVKTELFAARRDHLRCEKRCARIEAALIAAKIPLPPLPEEDDLTKMIDDTTPPLRHGPRENNGAEA